METNQEFNSKFHKMTSVIPDEQQNERVGFFLAKLAHEKGFDLQTEYSISMSVSGIGESKLYKNPTRSILQRWLKEVHNIKIFTSGKVEDLPKLLDYEIEQVLNRLPDAKKA